MSGKTLKNNKKLLKSLERIYGNERAKRIILAILESHEWNAAIKDMIQAKNWEEIDAAYHFHKPKLDSFLKQFANKKEKEGRSEDIVEHFGILDELSGSEWQEHIQEKDSDEKARNILPRDFFENEAELPWDDYPKLREVFLKTQEAIFFAVTGSNRILPPLQNEPSYKSAKFMETDRELINKTMIDEMSGVDEVRAFMPQSTQNLMDDIFGEAHTDLSDQFLIEMATDWKYPDLMVNYHRKRDGDPTKELMNKELRYMRGVFRPEGNLEEPLPQEDVECLAYWTAAQLVLFHVLDQELPETDETATKAMAQLRKVLEGKNKK